MNLSSLKKINNSKLLSKRNLMQITGGARGKNIPCHLSWEPDCGENPSDGFCYANPHVPSCNCDEYPGQHHCS